MTLEFVEGQHASVYDVNQPTIVNVCNEANVLDMNELFQLSLAKLSRNFGDMVSSEFGTG